MKYVCRICGYIYDEEKEGVAFAELPAEWKCPLCGAPKSEFGAEATGTPKAAAPKKSVGKKPVDRTAVKESFVKLSPGQMAAVCSNLARGSEKQYKAEEQALFLQLAEYFSAIAPAVNDATVEKLSEDLQRDVNGYGAMRAVADEAKDRGAARVCVWGEKVTRMLSSLLQLYLKEGEAMLADTEIWICTVCGFVYIGAKPPELCPVCKVPAWKFEKIPGRSVV